MLERFRYKFSVFVDIVRPVTCHGRYSGCGWIGVVTTGRDDHELIERHQKLVRCEYIKTRSETVYLKLWGTIGLF